MMLKSGVSSESKESDIQRRWRYRESRLDSLHQGKNCQISKVFLSEEYIYIYAS